MVKLDPEENILLKGWLEESGTSPEWLRKASWGRRDLTKALMGEADGGAQGEGDHMW